MPTPEQKRQHPVIAVLAYCGILCFIPLLLHKDNTFVQFHSKQGIALFMLEALAVFLASTVFGVTVSIVLLILCGIGSIIGIVAVLQYKEKKLPMLGWMVEKFNI